MKKSKLRKQLWFRLSESEADTVNRLARESKMTMSATIRMLVLLGLKYGNTKSYIIPKQEQNQTVTDWKRKESLIKK